MLVIVQPDLGSASVIVSIAMGVLLVAGAKIRYIFLISFLSVATVAAAFVGNLVNSYQEARIVALINPDCSGYRRDLPGRQRDACARHRGSVGQGLAARAVDQRR